MAKALVQSSFRIYLALLLMAVPVLVIVPKTHAAQINNRSIAISTSKPSATATHTFKFDTATTAGVGSIEFEYCTNSAFIGTPCTAPAGLDVSSSSLSSQSGIGGFALDPGNTTVNKLAISRVAAVAAGTTVTYAFSGITNPSTLGQSVYVRISTFAGSNLSGGRVDTGAVVFSIVNGLGVGAYVPPFIIFCAAVAVAQDCSATSGDSIDMGELSSKTANTATTQFSGASNSVTGFVVTAIGTTMTSGNNILPSSAVPQPSTVGVSQFGINMRANNGVGVGLDPQGAGTNTPSAIYNVPNKYAFIANDTIASSPLPSDFNLITVTYLVNVSKNQAPGRYATTITYLATAQF